MAKGNKIFDVEKLKKNLDKALRIVAEETGEKIQVAYVSTIQAFYGEYGPASYDRTYSTFKASSGYGGKPVFKKTGEMMYESGITLNPGFMGDPYRKKHGWDPSADFIFDRTFNKGIHGFTIGEVRIRNKGKTGVDRWVPGARPFLEYSGFPGVNMVALGLDSLSFLPGVGFKANIRQDWPGRAMAVGRMTGAPKKGQIPRSEMDKKYRKIRDDVGKRIDELFNFL